MRAALKTHIIRHVREAAEKKGGTFLHINWKKRKAHFLSSTGERKAEAFEVRKKPNGAYEIGAPL